MHASTVARTSSVWRKVHLGVDAQTLEVRAVEITGSHIGDAPMLPDLLSQVPEGQEIDSVTADGAYDTRKCHEAIPERGAHAFGCSLEPMSFASSLPPRKNAKPWETVTAGALAIVLGPMAGNGSPCNEALRAAKYLGRALWRR